MSKKCKTTLWVCVCAFVVTALLLVAFPVVQAHASTKKPAQVKGVKAASVKTSSIKIIWAKSSTKVAKGYQIKVYKSGKTFKTYTVSGRSSTSKTVTGLKAGSTYTTKVRAYTAKKSKKIYGKWSSAKKFTTKKLSSSISTSKYTDKNGCEFLITETEVRNVSWSSSGLREIAVHYRFTNKAKDDQWSYFYDLRAYQGNKRLSNIYEPGDSHLVISGRSIDCFTCFEIESDSDVLLRAVDKYGKVKLEKIVRLK